MIQSKASILLCFLVLVTLVSCDSDDVVEDLRVDSVMPPQAMIGDTITIRGNGFKGLHTTVVGFEGGMLGQVVSAEPTEIDVVVPLGARDGDIQVRTGKTAIVSADFELIPSPPFISDLAPSQGRAGSSFTILGDFLANNYLVSDSIQHIEEVSVLFGGQSLEIDSLNYENIWVKVPQDAADGEVMVQVERDGLSSNQVTFEVGIPAIIDDFNRPTTEWADLETMPNPIGSNWVIGSGEWMIEGPGGDNFISARRVVAGDNLMVNMPSVTSNQNGMSYSLGGDVYIPATTDSALGGIAFHVQSEDDYYAFRIGGGGLLQLIRVIDGNASAVLSTSGFAAQLPGNNTYRLEVSSNTPYTFDLRVLTAEGAVIVEGTVVDDQSTFVGGVAGFYSTYLSYHDNYYFLSEE